MMKFILLLLTIVSLTLAQSSVKIVNGDGTQTVGYNYNSGMTTLTNSAAVLTTSTIAVKIIHCANTTAGAVTLTITDNQGSPVTYWPAVSMAANSVMVVNYGDPGLTMLGVKWNASAGSSINCQLVGLR